MTQRTLDSLGKALEVYGRPSELVKVLAGPELAFAETSAISAESSALALIASVDDSVWAEAWTKALSRHYQHAGIGDGFQAQALALMEEMGNVPTVSRWTGYWSEVHEGEEYVREIYAANPVTCRISAAMLGSAIAILAGAQYPSWAQPWADRMLLVEDTMQTRADALRAKAPAPLQS